MRGVKRMFPTAVVAVISASGAFAAEVCRAPDVRAVSITTNAAGHVLLDFGRHAFGWLEADVRAKGPYTIVWGELLDADGSIQTNRRYTVEEGTIRCACTKGVFTELGVARIPYEKGNGSSFWEKPLGGFGTVMPFRWAEVVEAPFPVDHDAFRQVPVYYPYDMDEERFESSSPELDRVHDFCKHSIRATTFTGKFIDGDRERLPYEADSYITQLSTYAVTSDSTLVQRSIDHLEKNETWPTEWKQFFIRMCWADWMRTGDTSRLARCYDLFKGRKLWLQLARESDGLLVSANPETEKSNGKPEDICDWGRCYRDGFDFRPVNAIVNALHYRNLLEMADIAAALGKADDARFFKERACRVRDAFARVLIDPVRGIVRDGEGSTHFTVQANAMALACGVVPEANVAEVAEYIVKKGMSCSTYMAQFVLEALGRAGRIDDMLALITTRGERGWLAMMDKGATITMEFWDLTLKEPWRVPDMNHAWSTGPLNVISRFVLGVSALEPGYGRISIRPRFGRLERVSATVPTPRGGVAVSTRMEKGRRVIKVRTPVPAVFEAFGEVRDLEPGKYEFRY